jgi:hypothetical protein
MQTQYDLFRAVSSASVILDATRDRVTVGLSTIGASCRSQD